MQATSTTLTKKNTIFVAHHKNNRLFMTLIVITLPHLFCGEADTLNALFEAGLPILHLRKPQATASELRQLLQGIHATYHARIVTHDHFELADEFGLKGIHLNGRNPLPPAGYTRHLSCSCHSLAEVMERKPHCQYVFLSPIYDSISKEGYTAAFSPQMLREATRQGIIDSRVMALGGITLSNLPQIKALGFGGAAVLGDLWQQPLSGRVSYLQTLLQASAPASETTLHTLYP